MAFSPENKPYINRAFCCSVGVVGKWEPFPFSLRNFSCEKEGVGGGVRWNGGSSKMGHKGWPWMPRRLLSLLPGPWDLWVKICQLNLNVFCAHIKSLLRKPNWGRRESGGKKSGHTQGIRNQNGIRLLNCIFKRQKTLDQCLQSFEGEMSNLESY